MRILKNHPLLRLASLGIISASEPSSYLWNFGLGGFYLLPFYFKYFSSDVPTSLLSSIEERSRLQLRWGKGGIREMKSELTLDFWSNNLDRFYQWLAGFSEAEGCFKVKPKYRNDKSSVHSFYFEFEIHLHIDEINLLYFINSTLGIGKVYKRESSNSCSFIVGNEKDLRILIDIFDRYTFNGIKLLDYLDFKKAFFMYFNRQDTLSKSLSNLILKIKEGMNTGRKSFSMPKDHQLKVTKYWLLGLIEGEGSFNLSRANLIPNFQLLFTGAQKPLLEEIKNHFINNLNFDEYSLWKINNSSIISINDISARGNSKPTVRLLIKDVRFLNNYIIPYLSSMPFISKKGYDFKDFSLICKLLYVGAHEDVNIRTLTLQLSLGMNKFRLSSYKGAKDKSLTSKELELLNNAITLKNSLGSGYKNSVVYFLNISNNDLIVDSLTEAANLLNISSDTLRKLLAKNNEEAKVNNNLVKRIKIFC